jgi:sirohydrochlorin cobaltochelatase
MDAIILFSHGSLLCGSGDALALHAERLRSEGVAPIVEIGYLNYCEPAFSNAVDRCASGGAERMVVTPYFLAPGYFVNVDLPKCVRAARQAHPQLEFVIAEPIGYDARLADAIVSSANESAPHEHWRDDLWAASKHCRRDARCPLYGSPNCIVHGASVAAATEAR